MYVQIITFPYNNEQLPLPQVWESNDWKNLILIQDTKDAVTSEEFSKIKKEFETEWEFEDISVVTEELKTNYFVYYFYQNYITKIVFCDSSEDAHLLFSKEVSSLYQNTRNDEFVSVFQTSSNNYKEFKASQYTSDNGDVIAPDKNRAVGLVCIL